MTKAKLELGQKGEQIAIKFLRSKGYKILEHNFRTHSGEIDLIARHKSDLVFVEVKTRIVEPLLRPRESVDFRKQQKLTQLALEYLQTKNLTDEPCRFDVVEIILADNGCLKQVELIQDAFGLDW